jgi:hypothetical protein
MPNQRTRTISDCEKAAERFGDQSIGTSSRQSPLGSQAANAVDARRVAVNIAELPNSYCRSEKLSKYPV